MRLDDLNKVEWRDVVRKLNPKLTDAEFERMWDDFQKDKAERARRLSLH